MESVHAEKGLGSYRSFEDFSGPRELGFEHKFPSQTPDIISVWTLLGNQNVAMTTRIYSKTTDDMYFRRFARSKCQKRSKLS